MTKNNTKKEEHIFICECGKVYKYNIDKIMKDQNQDELIICLLTQNIELQDKIDKLTKITNEP